MWFRIACATGRTPDEAKATTPVTRYAQWQEFFDRELKRQSRSDFFLGRIAYEIYFVRAMFSTGKLDKSLADFCNLELAETTTDKKVPTDQEEPGTGREAMIRLSADSWQVACPFGVWEDLG